MHQTGALKLPKNYSLPEVKVSPKQRISSKRELTVEVKSAWRASKYYPNFNLKSVGERLMFISLCTALINFQMPENGDGAWLLTISNAVNYQNNAPYHTTIHISFTLPCCFSLVLFFNRFLAKGCHEPILRR